MRLSIGAGVMSGSPGGPERMVTRLVQAMTAQDPDLTVTLRASTLRRRDEAHVGLRRIGPAAQRRVDVVPPRISSRLRFPPERLVGGAFDVFHQFHLDANPVVPGHRLVVSVNDLVALDWPGHEGALQPFAGDVLRRAERVVAISDHTRADAVDRLGLDHARIEVVHLGVDHDLFTASEGPLTRASTERYLLFVGGATPRKNVERIVAALHLFRQDRLGHGTRLVLAGPVAHHEQRVRAAAPAGLDPDALQFVGSVTDAKLVDLYRGADALVYPSLAEGFGLPVLEAMACGTAVVTSTTTSLPEVGGDAAVYVDASDVESIAAGIWTACHGPAAQRAQRRMRGLDRAATFTWARSAQRLLAVYRSIA